MRLKDFYEATVYHGTAHDFDDFSTDHIGSGEGNQVYGWGLYFASRREVAEWYRDKLAPKAKVTISHQTFVLDSPEYHYQAKTALKRMVRYKLYTIEEGGTKQDKQSILEMFENWGYALIEDLLNYIAAMRSTHHLENETSAFMERLRSRDMIYEDEFNAWQKLSDLISQITAQAITLDIPAKGRLYQVQIPDNRHWLYWDENYSSQTPEVKAALQAKMSPPDVVLDYAGEYFPKAKDLYSVWDHWLENHNKGRLNGARLYECLSDDFGGDKQASLLLKGVGVTGIIYRDGASRNAGLAHYNYVLFDGIDAGIVAKH